MDDETIAEVKRRSPKANLFPVYGGLYVVGTTERKFGSPSSTMDEAWDMALMVLRQRDQERGKWLAARLCKEAVDEWAKGIDPRKTTLEDASLKLKQDIHNLLTKFLEDHIAVDVPGLED